MAGILLDIVGKKKKRVSKSKKKTKYSAKKGHSTKMHPKPTPPYKAWKKSAQ